MSRREDVELQMMHTEDEHARADAPLLAHSPTANGSTDRTSVKPTRPRTKTSLRNAGRVVWLLTCSAGISGLLFGYDTGVISSTLVSIGTDLSDRSLTTTDKSLITAVTSLFALLFAPTTGYLADQYGRRFVIFSACVLFILGALAQAVAAHVWFMVLGRAAVGAAVGLASAATPLYITELAPAELRGRLVTIQSLFITGGQVVAYLIGWAFASLPNGWRWMVGLGALPAILQAFLLLVMYETPRWLVKNGRVDRARTVLNLLYGGIPEDERHITVQYVLTDIETEIATESQLTSAPESTFKSLTTRPRHRRALTIACMLQALQQLCGFNSLMYFSATIFALVGFVYPIGTSLTIAGTNFLFTLVAFAFIDTIGRRNILLYSIPYMVVGLAISSLCFSFIGIDFNSPAPQADPSLGNEGSSGSWSIVLVMAMILYVASYAIGLGCVPWQQSELFPLQVRSLGSGIATATNWSSNFIIGITFLPMMELLGATTTFAVYAIVCVIGWIAVWRFYPETAGLELEGVGELLSDGYGVKESVERFRMKKAKARGERTVRARGNEVG